MNLSDLARKFHHFEAVSFERHNQSDGFAHSAGEVMRVGITTLTAKEQERVISIRPTAEEQAKIIEREIEGVFDAYDADEDAELCLAVLARISRKLMEQLEEHTAKE